MAPKPTGAAAPFHAPAAHDVLRHVRLESGHVLRTYDTGRTRGGRTCIGYTFSDPSGAVLFAGEDFRPSPMHADDSDATLRGLLGFLTLRPGDTDAEYFADYSPAQLAFAASDTCQLLAFIYSDDPSIVGSENAGSFEDIDDEDGDVIETTRCGFCGRVPAVDCCAAPAEPVRMRLPREPMPRCVRCGITGKAVCARCARDGASRVIDGVAWSREDYERAHGPHAARAHFGEGER